MSKVRLGTVSDIQAGPFGTQLHASDYVSDGTIMINAKNIGSGVLNLESIDCVSPEVCQRLNRYVLKNGDIVFGRAGSIDKHINIDEESDGFFQGTNCIRVRLYNSELATFISYYLWSPAIKKQISNTAGGSILQYLNTDLLSELKIPVVNIDEAKAVATLLKTLDKKIALNNRIISELEAMAKTIYDYWFVQFDFPNANGKSYRQSGGEMEYNEILKREIPKGWRAATLSAFIGEEKGGDWGKENCEGNYTEQVVCIRGADFPGLLGKKSLNAPARFILKKNTSKQLLAGDIIVEISGGSPTQSTGRISYINTEVLTRFDLPIITSNFCKAFSLKDLKWLYWFYILWEKLYQAGVFFKYEGKTTGIKNLLFDILCTDYAVVMPQKEIIYSFNETVEPFFKTIQKNNTENLELTRLRDWLLPMLMNGQATVADIEDPKVSIFPDKTKSYYDQRFEMWLQNQGLAARGDIDRPTLREIFDAMDDDDK